MGSDVQLRCIYPEKNSFDLNDLYVYWQISMAGKGNVDSVVTYHLSGNSSASHGDNHYKDRARLSLDSMKQGDFSLHLRNVTPQDEQKFNCLVFRKSLELKKILEVAVTLHVAGKTEEAAKLISSQPYVQEEVSVSDSRFLWLFHLCVPLKKTPIPLWSGV